MGGGWQHLSLRLLQRASVEAKKEKGSVCFATFDVRRADEEPPRRSGEAGPSGSASRRSNEWREHKHEKVILKSRKLTNLPIEMGCNHSYLAVQTLIQLF